MKRDWQELTSPALDDEIAVASLAQLLAAFCHRAAAAQTSSLAALRDFALRVVRQELSDPGQTDLPKTLKAARERVERRQRYFTKRVNTPRS